MEIDEKLKNRLAGASVVTVLAVIFLPMLFDDSVEKKQPVVSELSLPLKPEPSTLLTAAILPDSAEQVTEPEPPHPVAKKITPTTPPKSPPVSKTAFVTTPEKTAAAVQITQPLPVETTPPPPAKAGEKRWVIQVASLTDQAKANAFRDKLRSQGFSATVVTGLVKGNQVYRLNVGPELDAERAQATKSKINQLNHLQSFVKAE